MELILTKPLCGVETLNDLGASGRAITNVTKEVLRYSLRVAQRWQSARLSSGVAPEAWCAICRRKSRKRRHYSPRWTFPILYFRRPVAEYFAGAIGLDVGARISRPTPLASRLKLAAPPDREPEDLNECFVPHYLYYADIGCSMEAIDITLDTRDDRVRHADARMLPCSGESFDFITAPMLLGPSNVCATPIEVTLCVSEFARVLRPGGFFYLADPTIEPSVVYAAQCAGFDCYYSQGKSSGLPVGTVFRRTGVCDTTDRFRPLYRQLESFYLTLSDDADETIWSADLLWDQHLPWVQRSPCSKGRRRRHLGGHHAI